MTFQSERSASGTDPADSLAPSEAEIEAWAARERTRRQQWLSGPTPEQAAVAASREREGVEPDFVPAHRKHVSDMDAARLVQRSMRTAQLAAEGAMSLLLHVSLTDVRQRLVQAGLDWEEEFQDPTHRR